MRLWTRLYGMSGYGSVNYEPTPKFYVAIHLVGIARVHDIISYFWRLFSGMLPRL